MSRRGPVVALLGVVFLAACLDRSDEPEAGPRLVAEEGQVYGEAGGPGALSSVFDVAVSSTGRVFVSEPSFGRVVAFEPDGSFGGVVGERGPGEEQFVAPGKLGWRGDTLTVVDFRRGITLLSPEDGGYHGRVAFRGGGSDPAFPIHPFVLLPEGGVAAMAPIPPGLVAEGAVTTETWLRTDRTGRVLDTLLSRDARGAASVVELEGRRGTLNHPLASDPLWLSAPDGTFFVLVDRRPPADAEDAAFRLFKVDPRGDTLVRATVPFRPRVVDREVRDSIARAVAVPWAERTGLPAERVAATLDSQIPWAPFQPPVTRLLVGSDHRIWLRREGPVGDSVRWEVRDDALGPAGHVYLPDAFDVKAATAGHVYGVVRDPDGGPTVVRFQVRPEGG